MTVLRPALSSISPSRMNISPGIMLISLRSYILPDTAALQTGLSSNRLVHGHQLGAVREGRLDLNVVDHFGDPVHHLLAREHVRARLHQLGHGPAVACAFDDEIADQRHRLGMVELDTALEPPA